MVGSKATKKPQLFRGYPDVLTVKDLQKALNIMKGANYEGQSTT